MGTSIKLGAFLVLLSSSFVTAQENTCSTLDECENAIIEQGLKRESDKQPMGSE